MTNNNDCHFVSSSVHIILQNKGNWRIKVIEGKEKKVSLVSIWDLYKYMKINCVYYSSYVKESQCKIYATVYICHAVPVFYTGDAVA